MNESMLNISEITNELINEITEFMHSINGSGNETV